jgi:hypothetical protein
MKLVGGDGLRAINIVEEQEEKQVFHVCPARQRSPHKGEEKSGV